MLAAMLQHSNSDSLSSSGVMHPVPHCRSCKSSSWPEKTYAIVLTIDHCILRAACCQVSWFVQFAGWPSKAIRKTADFLGAPVAKMKFFEPFGTGLTCNNSEGWCCLVPFASAPNMQGSLAWLQSCGVLSPCPPVCTSPALHALHPALPSPYTQQNV